MLFNSFDFLVFFVLVTSLYFILPFKLRWLMLLTASCIFYMFFVPWYILILLFTIIIDYFAGILIERSPQKLKKNYLVLSILANVGILVFFKYYNFFIDNINSIASLFHWNYSLEALKMILPIGLSFHTFQAMSYTIEVYRGKQKAEKHFGIYALYVMYYPQLVAGPIERPQNLLPQFHTDHKFDFSRLISGLKLMLWGFFKKLVIADKLAPYVNEVYNAPQSFEGITIFIATVFFAIQIYCDFSGYSDIAIGASRIMGIDLMKNFRSPYLSKSVSEFWGRWHMSLSTWFKDYLYIPLGGNRVAKHRWFFNLAFVFIVSGFWHGANWTFIIWGALHGLYLILEIITANARTKFIKLLSLNKLPWLYNTFKQSIVFFLVCIAWVFFRASNTNTGFYIVKQILVGIPNYFYNVLLKPGYLWLEPLIFNHYIKWAWFDFLIIFAAITIMKIVNFYDQKQDFNETLNKQNPIIKIAFYTILVIAILTTGAFHNSTEFIYFQF